VRGDRTGNPVAAVLRLGALKRVMTRTGDGTATANGRGTAGDRRTSDDGRPPAVDVEGLTKRFGSGPDAVTAVDDVSFAVDPGEVVGLLGPNGAGKTTLVKSILGLVLPDAGTVCIDGVDVAAAPRRAHARVDATLEGARNDYWRLTVRENLRYFATVGGVDPDSVADRHDRLLDQFDLAAKADEPVRNLSRGMKQKVSLASALAGDASVVFLDEPTLGLDVESSLTLRRELRRTVEDRGLTVVLGSHDMDVVEDLCDRVVVMSDGRVVADDTVPALLGGAGRQGYRVTSPDIDGDLVAALRDRFDVTAVDRVGDAARVEVAADSDGFYALVEFLAAAGVTVRAVDTVSPDLAEVFVDLTRGDAGDRP
jgi:ABC-2 type transport system ATP-binding protein